MFADQLGRVIISLDEAKVLYRYGVVCNLDGRAEPGSSTDVFPSSCRACKHRPVCDLEKCVYELTRCPIFKLAQRRQPLGFRHQERNLL